MLNKIIYEDSSEFNLEWKKIKEKAEQQEVNTRKMFNLLLVSLAPDSKIVKEGI